MRFDARTFQELLDAIKASGKSAHVLSHKAMEALEVGDSVYGGTLYPANDKKDWVLRHHSYMLVAKNSIDPVSNKRYLTLIGITKAGYPEVYTAYLDDCFPEGNSFFLQVENRPKGEPLTLQDLKKMEGKPVWVHVLDHENFADSNDDFDGWGLCRKSWVRVWDEKRADLIHIDYDFKDYGKEWIAYPWHTEEA